MFMSRIQVVLLCVVKFETLQRLHKFESPEYDDVHRHLLTSDYYLFCFILFESSGE